MLLPIILLKYSNNGKGAIESFKRAKVIKSKESNHPIYQYMKISDDESSY